MPLTNDLISSLVTACCQDVNVDRKEKAHLVRLAEITLTTFEADGDVSPETYIAFLQELRSLCVTLSEGKERTREKWEKRVQAAKTEGEDSLDEVYASIYAIAGTDPKPEVVRRILTAIVNCERSSVPSEFQNEFLRLQKAFGIDKFLDN